MQDVLEGELAHGRQVQRLLDPANLLENPERENGVIQTIPDDLLGVSGPLLVDLSPRELVFSLPQQLASHVVERLLLHVQAQALRLDRPPYVREDPAVDPPEPLAEVEEVREVTGELEPRNPVLGGAIDEHGQVVAVDVVSGDDVGVELVDEFDEPLDDFPLLPLEDAGLDFTGLPVRDPDAENVVVQDAVLDVEAEHSKSRAERVAWLEALRDEEQVSRVPAGRVRRRPVDADRGSKIHVVDEPMLEGDVGLQRGRSVPPRFLAVFRCFPRLPEDDAGARGGLALDLEGHVLELDHLRIPPERPAERLRRLDDEEVRLESGVLDRDALPFPRTPEELDHRQLRLLGAVPGLPSI